MLSAAIGDLLVSRFRRQNVSNTHRTLNTCYNNNNNNNNNSNSNNNNSVFIRIRHPPIPKESRHASPSKKDAVMGGACPTQRSTPQIEKGFSQRPTIPHFSQKKNSIASRKTDVLALAMYP